MTNPLGTGGYQPPTNPAERRAFFDLLRRVVHLESNTAVNIIGEACPVTEGPPPTGLPTTRPGGDPLEHGDAYFCDITGDFYMWTDPPGEYTNIGPLGVKEHDQLGGVTADQHHPQVHDLDSHSDVTAPTPADEARLTWNGAAWAPVLSDRMEWQGVYNPNLLPYDLHDVTRDTGWTMVCIEPTGCTEKPAPQPVGPVFDVYNGASPTAALLAKQIIFGQKYTFGSGGYITALRIWTVIGNEYSLWVVFDPDGTPIIEEVANFTAVSGGWLTVNIASTLIGPGTVIEVLGGVIEPDPTPTVWTAPWDYQTPQNAGAPAAGDAQHGNSTVALISINYIDDVGGDHSNSGIPGERLTDLDIGDIIAVLGNRYAIQSITDNGTYITFGIAPGVQSSPDGVTDFTFETVTATPITIVQDPDYWLTNTPAGWTITGTYKIDDQPEVVNNSAYGTDITVQEALISDQWQVVASPGSSGGGGGGGASYLDDLLDVQSAAASAQQVLTWNDLEQYWEAAFPVAAAGFAAFGYRFGTATDGTPGAGYIEFNNADPSLVTEVYVHELDEGNNDISLFLEYMTVGGWLNIGDRGNYQAHHHAYDVITAQTEVGQIWTFPVALFQNVGLAFANNQQVNLVLRFPASSGANALDDLTDVTAVPRRSGDVLGPDPWSATEWVGQPDNLYPYASRMVYQFDSSQTTTPAAGYYSLNSASGISATKAYINRIGSNGADYYRWLNFIKQTGWQLAAHRDPSLLAGESGEWNLWKVGNSTLNGAVYELDIIWDDQAITGLLPNDQETVQLLSTPLTTGPHVIEGDPVADEGLVAEGQLLYDPDAVPPGAAQVLDDLDDVDTTTTPPVAGDLLEFDGTNWVPQDTAWTLMDLSAGPFQKYPGFGNEQGYRKLGDVVHFSGFIQIVGDATLTSTLITNLPVGYRPLTQTTSVQAQSYYGNATLSLQTGELRIGTDGNVYWYKEPGQDFILDTGWVSLDNVSFPIR